MKKRISVFVVSLLLLLACLGSVYYGQIKQNGYDSTAQLFVCGISACDVFKMTKNDVISVFGEPDNCITPTYLEYGGEPSDQITFSFGLEGYVDYIDASANKFTYNDQSLNQDIAVLDSILGSDYKNLGGAYGIFEREWTIDGFKLIVAYPKLGNDEGYFIPLHISVQ